VERIDRKPAILAGKINCTVIVVVENNKEALEISAIFFA